MYPSAEQIYDFLKTYRSIIIETDCFEVLRKLLKHLNNGKSIGALVTELAKKLDQSCGAVLKDVIYSKQLEVDGLKVVRKVYKIKRVAPQ